MISDRMVLEDIDCEVVEPSTLNPQPATKLLLGPKAVEEGSGIFFFVCLDGCFSKRWSPFGSLLEIRHLTFRVPKEDQNLTALIWRLGSELLCLPAGPPLEYSTYQTSHLTYISSFSDT